MIRVRAGISYALTEAMDEGIAACRPQIGAACRKSCWRYRGIDPDRLDLELSEGTVIADSVGGNACVFLAGLYRAEQAIAERLMTPWRMAELPWPCIDADKAIPWVEHKYRPVARGKPGSGGCDWRWCPRCWSSPAVPASARPPS